MTNKVLHSFFLTISKQIVVNKNMFLARGLHAATVRELSTIVSLVQQLCETSPAVFCEGAAPLEAYFVLRALPFLGEQAYATLHEGLLVACTSTLLLLYARDLPALRLFFQGAATLLQGLLPSILCCKTLTLQHDKRRMFYICS